MNLNATRNRILTLAICAGLGLGPGFCAAAPDDGQDSSGPKCTMSSKKDDATYNGGTNDPQNALSGNPTGGFSFHTDNTPSPSWWMVDLGKGTPVDVDYIKIYNRMDDNDAQKRAQKLSIWLAPDNGKDTAPTTFEWQGLAMNKPHGPATGFYVNTVRFGGVTVKDPTKETSPKPLQVQVSNSINHQKIRFIKIQLTTPNEYLHLDQVIIQPRTADSSTKKKPLDLNTNTDPNGLLN